MAVFCIIVFRETEGFVVVASQHFRDDCPTNFSHWQPWSFSPWHAIHSPTGIKTAQVALESERQAWVKTVACPFNT